MFNGPRGPFKRGLSKKGLGASLDGRGDWRNGLPSSAKFDGY